LEELNTTQFQIWHKRMKAGDQTAREELVRAIVERMERLARKMLRNFPNVRRWEQTDDILQNAMMRLLRSLEKVEPSSVRELFGLAALEIRRELMDLARHFGGPEGQGAHHASHQGDEPGSAWQPPDINPDVDLEKWTAFHREVENLPVEEREVVGLMFYNGMSSTEAAEIFQVSDRTIRRWWNSAMLKLHQYMQDSGLAD
jgi:RNA polymerase sigma-70 factor (ECF subfamily)